jgi:putative drug exporter of the RND superfamily
MSGAPEESSHSRVKACRRPIGVRRPRPVLAGAAAVLGMLLLLGAGVEQKLKPTSVTVPGTEAARGNQLLKEHFGDSAPFAILLQGPPAQLDRQGSELVEILLRNPGVTTLSPWDRGPELEGLRPSSGTALVLADFHVSEEEAIERTVPELERTVARNVSDPVHARTAGFASVARATDEEAVDVARRGEAIVAPILLLVLLLVFRSPVAAAIPLVFGATTVIATRGLLSVLAGAADISGFALSIASMIGLALGVDYALLIVSRFREELEAGSSAAEAASITRMTAGSTTVFAGATLFISILIAAFLVPGMLLLSLCITVGTAVVVAVAGPWVVAPAILVMLGKNIDRWRIGGHRPVRTRWLIASRAVLRRPLPALVVTGLLLAAIASPALTLATGPLTIKQLPADNRTRLDVEAIEAAVGGGWITPSLIVATSRSGPMTAPHRLAVLDRWQATVEKENGVEAVIGPGQVARPVAPLRRAGRGFLADGGGRGEAARMVASLSRAGDGLGRLRRGLGRASEGAHALTLGSGRAEEGAGLLARGLAQASAGGAGAGKALARFRRGAHRVADGQRSALLGTSLLGLSAAELRTDVVAGLQPEARRLKRDLARAEGALPVTRQAAGETVEELETAWRELNAMSTGAADPHYPALATAIREALTAASGSDPLNAAPYARDYSGLPGELSTLAGFLKELDTDAGALGSRLGVVRSNVALLRTLATRLERGVQRLQAGSKRLAGGSDRIVAAARRLGSGLARLGGGAERLSHGLARLRGGNAALQWGLLRAFHRTGPLVSDSRAIGARIVAGRSRLRRTSPGFFDSGYFVLSALDGSPPRQRGLAGQAFDLEKGGRAMRLFIVSDRGLDDPDAESLNDRLRELGASLARQTDSEVAVTGALAQSTEYNRATSDRLPALVVLITLITFAVMVAILRALPLATIAIVLNLLAVAAAFGVLRILFLVPAGLHLGETDHIDPVGAAGIFGVVFGLSIDYAVFLLTRMREGWERSGDADTAIAFGLERTGSVITGAATIMAVVFGAFATASIESVAQFGIALTVAVLLDATLIRLMLLPALMKLIGPRVWWLPAWLDRRLPRLNVHGAGARA